MSSESGASSAFTIERGTPPPFGALRRWIARVLPPLGANHLWAVQLVVTELATNAYEHGAGPVRVTWSVTDRPCSVLLEVQDDGEDRPVAGPPASVRPRGRGLVLVGDLSREWGVRPEERGKTVWARIDCGAPMIDACSARAEPIIMDPEPC
ncbi:ATP-binding protein [Amycolatopsis balhimycina DSM 5908]|uniref:ATP-binding protein n=1 Tax=Amycolatopsis balhimycina DSM 5908 TaxID=1081091 RepID=A0A428W3H7_AMYBA|nr:ATP-binding protein [Amycolatopsis balhimycina]RSM37631.1 ATP-binding protein [Amycolatopsis balhimycina DSM 5908]